jgi:hypothetical protein
MKPPKDPRLIVILTGVISFGAGYLAASSARGPQPQGVVPSAAGAAADWEEAKRRMDPGMRHVLGLDASPTPDNYQPKTWLPVNK